MRQVHVDERSDIREERGVLKISTMKRQGGDILWMRLRIMGMSI